MRSRGLLSACPGIFLSAHAAAAFALIRSITDRMPSQTDRSANTFTILPRVANDSSFKTVRFFSTPHGKRWLQWEDIDSESRISIHALLAGKAPFLVPISRLLSDFAEEPWFSLVENQGSLTVCLCCNYQFPPNIFFYYFMPPLLSSIMRHKWVLWYF